MSELRYNHLEIEPRWQAYWEERGLFKVSEDPKQTKYYVLEMFAYPSAHGLHVGHPRNYIATDIFTRYQKMHGLNVLHPVGWDSFGLPTENYAIKNNVHPAEATKDNLENIRRQVRALGFGYDWSREFATSEPTYYKWTQWLFKTLFEAGIAYQKDATVNWCPVDATVLANEQVVDGHCDRCGSLVEQRKMRQWFFRITDFAEELLEDLDTLDWPTSTKESQRNWIGKSEGGVIEFKVKDSTQAIKVFTTRPDTLYGATFLVLAPEHAQVTSLVTPGQRGEIEAYVQKSKLKNDLDRTIAKSKTGMFTGSYAINPGTGSEIPIYIADYVLGSYGYGAIMGVPAHDERDHGFAEEFSLDIIPVVESSELPFSGEGKLINSGQFDGLESSEAGNKILAHVGGKKETTYKLRDWSVSRQRYWGAPIPIVYDPEGNPQVAHDEDLPIMLPSDADFKPHGEPPLATSIEFQKDVAEKYGVGWMREVETMDTFVDSSWYYLRYCDPHNETMFAGPETLHYWMPVDLYIGGPEHTNGHLLYARFITKALHKLGYLKFNEPFMKLRHQGIVLAADGSRMSKSKGNVVNPDELIEQQGADTLRMYEMFMGPFEQNVAWDTNGVIGVRKFLDKTYRLIAERAESFTPGTHMKTMEGHRLVSKITRELEQMKFNTCVSGFMEFINEQSKSDSIDWLGDFVLLLSPFAPHIAEELWQNILKQKGSVLEQGWPQFDQNKLVADTVKIVVQEAGKLRGTVVVPTGADEQVVRAAVAEDIKLQEVMARTSRAIYIEDKVINFV